MAFTYLDDIAIADAAFEATGPDLPALFASAAEATMQVMVDDLDAIEDRTRRRIELTDEELDMLLFQFLQEFIYYKDAEDLLLRVADLDVSRSGDLFLLRAEARGERRDPSRHRLNVDVKAVTLHRFKVERTGADWKATVVLDV